MENVAESQNQENQNVRLDNTVTSREKYKQYQWKTITSGTLVEVYQFEVPLMIGRKPFKSANSIGEIRDDEYKKRSATKAVSTIRRLIHANFEKYAKFISLTFKNTEKFNIQSLTECNDRKVTFLAKLRSINHKVKYICVPEYQDRGAVHYHVICNLPYLEKKVLKKLWPYGFSDIRAIDEVSRQAHYVAKYVQKNRLDPRFDGRRTYVTSTNLLRPVINYGNKAKAEINKIAPYRPDPIRQGRFETARNGVVLFAQFVVPELKRRHK